MGSEGPLSRLSRFYPWALGFFGLLAATVYYFTGDWFLLFRENPKLLISLFDIHPAFGIFAYGVIGWVAGWVIRAIDRFQVSR